jgi:hypothetical protein
VVRGGEIVSTHATIKAAMDAKFELSRCPERKVIAFKADGTEITSRIRQVA